MISWKEKELNVKISVLKETEEKITAELDLPGWLITLTGDIKQCSSMFEFLMLLLT